MCFLKEFLVYVGNKEFVCVWRLMKGFAPSHSGGLLRWKLLYRGKKRRGKRRRKMGTGFTSSKYAGSHLKVKCWGKSLRNKLEKNQFGEILPKRALSAQKEGGVEGDCEKGRVWGCIRV